MTPNIIRFVDNLFSLRCVSQFIIAIGVICIGSWIAFGQSPLDPGRMNIGSNPTASKLGVNLPPPKTSSNISDHVPTVQASVLTRDEAIRLALIQASAFQAARYAELIAAEDVKQSRIAFLPRIAIPSTFVYNSPTLGPISADKFSFIAANAVTEYQSLASATGEIDIVGRLRAGLRRSVALLEAARAGTEVARRTLIQGVDDAYFGLALSNAKRRSAELTLAAAEDFARVTELMLNAGEVAEVDLIRARLQVASRRDDFEQARATETANAGILRVLVGYDFSTPIEVVDLATALPDGAEINQFVSTAITARPEFAQLEAERRAAEQEARAARAERLPQLTYSINGGFDSDSLHPDPLHDHTGVLATVSINIPIFDWGASRSREQQAQLRMKSFQSERELAMRNLTQQFYAARSQALAAVSRYQFLNQSVGQAERNVQASIARYRSGEAPIIEVTDSQSTLAAQRAALYQAMFDYQQARARLIQLTVK